MEYKDIIEKCSDLEKRVGKLENLVNQKNERQHNYKMPENIKKGCIEYSGNFESADGKMGAKFGESQLSVDKLFKCNSFEMAQVVTAFSAEERINIVKELLQNSLTAKQLMERLKFTTTGKLYHHLSFLEKLGVVRKDCEQYHVSARYAGNVLLIFAGIYNIIK